MRPLLLAFALLATTVSLRAADPAPEKLQLFLLIGQSNMAGRGVVEPQDQVTNPRIFMLTKDLQWTLAKDPLHYDKPTVAGVGLGSEFARVVAKANPEAKIGLIPAAFGGTSMAQWKPGGALYKDAVARAREAMKSGTLAGILWHQGESDSGLRTPTKRPDPAAKPEPAAQPAEPKLDPAALKAAQDAHFAAYGEQFAAMIAQLRKDLDAADVPLLVGELGRYNEKYQPFNRALPATVAKIPKAALVSSGDLVAKSDNVHFDSPSLRKFGARYAEAFLKMKK